MERMARVFKQLFYSLCLFSDFISLLDNYEMSTGVTEHVTKEELQENHLFLDAILKTEVMKVSYRSPITVFALLFSNVMFAHVEIEQLKEFEVCLLLTV